jgi:hypothetical protein
MAADELTLSRAGGVPCLISVIGSAHSAHGF